MDKKYDYLISIDPAGVGKSGTIVIDLKTWKIVYKNTFESESITQAIHYFCNLFNTVKLHFSNNAFIWVEDFYLNKKVNITNPLATPKLIGALEALAKYMFNWEFKTYLPSEKNKFKKQKYQGNMKLTQHEEDAWFGAQKFKEQYYG